jgi:hypothetical protein
MSSDSSPSMLHEMEEFLHGSPGSNLEVFTNFTPTCNLIENSFHKLRLGQWRVVPTLAIAIAKKPKVQTERIRTVCERAVHSQ